MSFRIAARPDVIDMLHQPHKAGRIYTATTLQKGTVKATVGIRMIGESRYNANTETVTTSGNPRLIDGGLAQ